MAANESRIQQAAQFLFGARAAREPYQPIPKQFAPRTIKEAYEIQDACNELVQGGRGSIAGYKIALTTPIMHRLVGFDEPSAGAVIANEIHHSPASIRVAD